MRTLFWNVRGLGSSQRRKLVRNHILQENLNVVNLERWKGTRSSNGFGLHLEATLGLVIGFNNDLLELEDSRSGLYSLSILVRIRSSNFRFWLVNVYGPANHEFLEDFLGTSLGSVMGNLWPSF